MEYLSYLSEIHFPSNEKILLWFGIMFAFVLILDFFFTSKETYSFMRSIVTSILLVVLLLTIMDYNKGYDKGEFMISSYKPISKIKSYQIPNENNPIQGYSNENNELNDYEDNQSKSQPSYDNQSSPKQNKNKCYQCNGTGKCKSCNKIFTLSYYDYNSHGWKSRNETKPGYLMHSQCFGRGYYKGGEDMQNNPKPKEECNCMDGWVFCSECNSSGHSEYIGLCSYCKGSGYN